MLLESQICENFYHMYKMLRELNQFCNKAYVFHIANERKTSFAYGAKLKRMGVAAGVPDYCVIYDGGRVAFIEFKRNNKSRMTPNQLIFKEMCDSLGTPYLLAHDPDEAIEFIKAL